MKATILTLALLVFQISAAGAQGLSDDQRQALGKLQACKHYVGNISGDSLYSAEMRKAASDVGNQTRVIMKFILDSKVVCTERNRNTKVECALQRALADSFTCNIH